MNSLENLWHRYMSKTHETNHFRKHYKVKSNSSLECLIKYQSLQKQRHQVKLMYLFWDGLFIYWDNDYFRYHLQAETHTKVLAGILLNPSCITSFVRKRWTYEQDADFSGHLFWSAYFPVPNTDDETYWYNVFRKVGLCVIRFPDISIFLLMSRIPWVGAVAAIATKLKLGAMHRARWRWTALWF